MILLPKPKAQLFKTELGVTHGLAKFTEKFGNQLLIVLILLIGTASVGINKLSVENRF